MAQHNQRFSNMVIKHRWRIIATWAIISGIILLFAPKLESVLSNDQSGFLPKDYESSQAQDIALKAFPENAAATSTIVFKNKYSQPLTPKDSKQIDVVVNSLLEAQLPKTTAIFTSDLQKSPDGKLQLAQVFYRGNSQDKDVMASTQSLRNKLAELTKNTTITSKVTGEVATGYDTQDTFDNALKIVGIGTIILILLLPAFVFRSPFVGLLPVAVVGLVYSISTSLLALLAHIFNFKVNQQLTILITVVAYGVGTDYILFLLFRYREKLRSGDHTKNAVSFALSHAGEAILLAALVVASSFTALFFAKFGILSSFAPGLVVLVGVMMLAALTLVPALVAVLETKLFWPSKAWMSHTDAPSISKKLGKRVSERPGKVAGILVAVLLLLSIGALQYKADFTTFSQPPKNTDSGSAFDDLSKSFPAGVLYPTVVYVHDQTKQINDAELMELVAKLNTTQGVGRALPPIYSTDKHDAAINVVLTNDPYSAAAFKTVSGSLHITAHSIETSDQRVYVGGLSATFSDIEKVTNKDLATIFPIAALFIFILLALLLRSLVAPLYLVLVVSLGFAGTLGANVFLFTGIGSASGLIFIVPILLYVFVVAIGTDYNILTITRLREEVVSGKSTKDAVAATIEHSSATVVSAGIILAGSFASLLLAKISFLTQMGATIAIGVMISAFVVAPILVPSLAAKLGKAIWWPGHKPKK